VSGAGGAGGPGDPGEAALMPGRVLAAAGQVSLPVALAAAAAVLAAAARRRRRTAGNLPLRDAGEAHREPGKPGRRDG